MMTFNTPINQPSYLLEKSDNKLTMRRPFTVIGGQQLKECESQSPAKARKTRPASPGKTRKVRVSSSSKKNTTKQLQRIVDLQHKLQSIETMKHGQLQEIEDRKQAEMARIRSQYKKDPQVQQESDALDEKVARAKTIISHLKRENKKLREKNKALRRAIDKMVQENAVLSTTSTHYSENTQVLTSNMKQMKDQKSYLDHVVQQLKEHVEKFEEAIELRDEAVLCENRVGRSYLNSLREITMVVDERGDSAELINEIDDCFMNAHNCKGLEETERELSESNF